MTGRAYARDSDGREEDITEGVQALYDLVISSMNWGSGFWSAEDALPVAKLGRMLGFEQIDEVERYVADRKHDEETQQWRWQHPEAGPPVNPASVFTGQVPDVMPHEHIYSSVGRCMWPRCSAKTDQ